MLGTMPRHVWVALAVAICFGGCAGPTTSFPNATPGEPRTVDGWEERPHGTGPFPAVVLMHGCHGVSESTLAWARWLRARRYVALIVDSWRPRGITNGCLPGPEIPNTERLDDAIGALHWLAARPYVDRTRIGIMGWSNGGAFAISAVNEPTLDRARSRGVVLPEPGFAAAVAFYPGACFSLVDERVMRPLLVLMGDADDWTLPADCERMVSAMRGRGADATIVLYPGAVHYFDVAGQPRTVLPDVENRNRPGGCCGATVGHDAAADADAHRRVEAFLARHLGGR